MAASSQTGVSRKIWFLGIGIVLVIALYTAGWFYAADSLKTNVLSAMGRQDANGISSDCADIEFRGFPFRIGLFCSKVEIDDKRNSISARFGALRSAAQVYSPGHIVWELDPDAEIRTSNGLAISADWTSLQSSLVTRFTSVQRTSTVIENLQATVVSAQTGQTFNIDSGRTEIHLRQNGGDLDAAALLDNTSIVARDWPQLLPAFSASADITLAGKAGLIDGKDTSGTALYGTQGELRRVVADIGEGRVMTLTGPFSVDGEGYLSGTLRLEIERIDAWRDSLKQVFPELASTLDTAGRLLSALVRGNDTVSVDLAINRGRVTVGGLIPVGTIPPI